MPNLLQQRVPLVWSLCHPPPRCISRANTCCRCSRCAGGAAAHQCPGGASLACISHHCRAALPLARCTPSTGDAHTDRSRWCASVDGGFSICTELPQLPLWPLCSLQHPYHTSCWRVHCRNCLHDAEYRSSWCEVQAPQAADVELAHMLAAAIRNHDTKPIQHLLQLRAGVHPINIVEESALTAVQLAAGVGTSRGHVCASCSAGARSSRCTFLLHGGCAQAARYSRGSVGISTSRCCQDQPLELRGWALPHQLRGDALALLPVGQGASVSWGDAPPPPTPPPWALEER